MDVMMYGKLEGERILDSDVLLIPEQYFADNGGVFHEDFGDWAENGLTGTPEDRIGVVMGSETDPSRLVRAEKNLNGMKARVCHQASWKNRQLTNKIQSFGKQFRAYRTRNGIRLDWTTRQTSMWRSRFCDRLAQYSVTLPRMKSRPAWHKPIISSGKNGGIFRMPSTYFEPSMRRHRSTLWRCGTNAWRMSLFLCK